ncbi:MFS general substrate transporter [Haematococcus lacustris]
MKLAGNVAGHVSRFNRTWVDSRALGSPRVQRARRTVPRAAITRTGAGDLPQEPAKQATGLLRHVKGLFNVFSDEAANSKLIALAVGQMLCSVATLIHDSYLPVYVQDELGLSSTKIGAVQGGAQFLCQISKGVSGIAGDLLGSQIRVLVFGTFLTLLCKPMFAMLSSVYGVFGLTACLYWFFAAKLMDRLSKGIREAPTKACMNELARASGDAPDAAYGLRQSLATAGMLLGSTVASLTFALTKHNYVLTFSVAAVFPALALIWMVQNFKDELFGARTPAASSGAAGSSKTAAGSTPAAAAASTRDGGQPAAAPSLGLLGKAKLLVTAFKPAYWQALVVVAVLYFARFDAAFLSLRAKQVMSKAALPMLTLVNMLIQVVLTAPLARYSGSSVAARNQLLLLGFLAMIACNACFALPITANAWGMFLGAGLLGLHMALTHSITVSMIASYMPTGEVPGLGKISGTAVSFTDLLLGFILAASNTMAGVLSDMTRTANLGNVGCFAGGATACVAAAVLLMLFSRFGELGREDLVVRKPRKATS